MGLVGCPGGQSHLPESPPREAGLCLQHSAGMHLDSGPVTMRFLEEALVLFWLLTSSCDARGDDPGCLEGPLPWYVWPKPWDGALVRRLGVLGSAQAGWCRAGGSFLVRLPSSCSPASPGKDKNLLPPLCYLQEQSQGQGRGDRGTGCGAGCRQQLEPAVSRPSWAELCPPAQLCRLHGKLLQLTTPRRAQRAPAVGTLGAGQRLHWLPDSGLSMRHLAEASPAWR